MGFARVQPTHGIDERGVTADTDFRLTRQFRLSDGVFLRPQARCALMEQRRTLGDRLKAIKPGAA